MGLPGGLQVRVKSPESSLSTALVPCWTLPVYAVAMKSPSVMFSTGDAAALIKPRIAEALGISEGQTVEFEIICIGENVFVPVTISDSITSDVLLHDFFKLKIAESIRLDNDGEKIRTKSGKVFSTQMQEMWAGMRVVQKKGTICLYFDGASRNNPKGPAGHGFRIVSEDGRELVRGYGYGGMNRSNNEMEYSGLIDGLHWAGRLDTIKLVIRGDSELILNQVQGVYNIRNPKLQALYAQVTELLEKVKDYATVEFEQIPRDENVIADCLANLAIDTQQNLTACNWQNINRFMKVRRHY